MVLFLLWCLRLIERMRDTSLAGVSAPDTAFCMTGYKDNPIANLTIHLEARCAGMPVFYGDCAVQNMREPPLPRGSWEATIVPRRN